MKKILFILLLLPALVFGQATGKVISDKPAGGSIGSAATTVDIVTLFNVNQTTASQTLTVPNLTNAAAGKIIYINNVGSTSFTLSPGGLLLAGYGTVLRWTGAAWNVCGIGTTGGTVSGLTTNYYPIATSATTIGDGWLYQDANNVFITNNKIITSANGLSYLDFSGGNNFFVGYNTGAIDVNVFGGADSAYLSWEDGTDNGRFSIEAAQAKLSHSDKLTFNAPVYNFNQGTANYLTYLNSSKNMVASWLYQEADSVKITAGKFITAPDGKNTIDFGNGGNFVFNAGVAGIELNAQLDFEVVAQDNVKFTGISSIQFTAPAVRFNSSTALTVPYLDANKDFTSSAVTPTELGYVSGVTSAIQTQLDTKLAKVDTASLSNRIDAITGGSSYWTTVPGTPVRVGNTSFTITDASNANLYNLLLGRLTILKWTDTTTKMAMVVSATYASNDVTITIIGDILYSTATMNTFKYSMEKCKPIIFSIAGTLATGTDLTGRYYSPAPLKVFGADGYHGTAGTTNATDYDINKNGTSVFTTKVSIASGATSGLGFTANSGTTTALSDYISVDCDAVSTTAPIDTYIQLFTMPLYNQHLN